MKNLTETAKHIQSHILDWVLFKGPELFITIYGK